MARPVGSKSNYSKRNNLSYKQIKNLIDDYGTLCNKELLNKYKISQTQLKNIRKQYQIKPKKISHLLNRVINLESEDKICGVYAICRNDFRKSYIGSSVDVNKRILNHIECLQKNKHYNIELQEDFNKNNKQFYYFLIAECEESDLLKIENDAINQINKGILYNKLYHDEKYDARKIYKNIESKISKKNNFDDCWEWNGKKNKDGYGVICCANKYLLIHRISYIYHNDEYPYIVHHTCHNKICCNPKHLKSVSSKENSIDLDKDLFLKRSKIFKHKEQIVLLRNKGYSYKKIKEDLDIDCSESCLYNFCKKLREAKEI